MAIAVTALSVADNEFTKPQLLGLWKEVLHVSSIRSDDDFFGLGADSLRAMRLAARIQQTFQVELPLSALFESPTLAAMSARIGTLRASAQAQLPARAAYLNSDAAELPPASHAQQRMWLLWRYDVASALYNVPFHLRLQGELDVPALQASLQKLVQRHDALRTNIVTVAGTLRQRVQAPDAVDLQFETCVGILAEDRAKFADGLCQQEASRPFDIEKGQVWRAKLLQIAPNEHVLLLTFHHVCVDEWSLDIILRELKILYNDCLAGRPDSLPPLTVRAADFPAWQGARLSGETAERQQAYWRRQLPQGVHPLGLRNHRPALPDDVRGARIQRVFNAETVGHLQRAAQEHRCTFFMMLLAVVAVLLRCRGAGEDIIVGSPISNRLWPEFQTLVGMFLNILPLRVDLSGDPNLSEIIKAAWQTTLDAFANQDIPYEQVLKLVNPQKATAFHSLLDVGLVLNQELLPVTFAPHLKVTPSESATATSKFDLTFFFMEKPQGLETIIEYRTSAFDRTDVQRLLDDLPTVIDALTQKPGQRLAAFLQNKKFTEEASVEFPPKFTSSEVRGQCVHQVFADQVRRSPDATAISLGEDCLTYAELNARANFLAHSLLKLGVKPGQPIAVYAERSLETIVALLAVLKAGGAYVPMDPAHPLSRTAFMLKDSGSPVLITQRKFAAKLPEFDREIVWLDDLNGASSIDPPTDATPDSLCNVIYTSGTTGQPKGTLIPHRGVVRLVKGADYVSLGSDEVFLLLSSLSFDASTFEIWAPLLNGGKLALMPPGTPTLGEIGATIRRHGVTTLWLTAGLFHLMVDEAPEHLRPLRQLLAGGDVLSPRHVRKLLQLMPGLRLINGYGPTENTTFTCCYTAPADFDGNRNVPIGKPINGTEVLLLDDQLQPVAPGAWGELCAGGEGLARGYLNLPELTAQRFVPHPLRPDDPTARLYRTGDYARWGADGNIEFLGRRDHQVKIRGFRVEIGEVESALRRCAWIKDAAVLAKEDDFAGRRLVAYIVKSEMDQPRDEQSLVRELADALPTYMMPSAFIYLDAMPLNPSGKIDREALPKEEKSPASIEPSPSSETPSLLEHHLVQIWSRVLGDNHVRADSNFFDLGGHSLLAIRLLAEIDKLVGRRLPLNYLFHTPTPRSMARLLADESAAPQWSHLVPIQPIGDKPPLFFTHGVGGDVHVLVELGRLLGEDQPVYGLQSSEADDVEKRPKSLEEMAARYAAEIRSFQEQGPYCLAGFSVGGMVAFEIAQNLRRQGQTVAFLGLIDTFPSRLPWRVAVPWWISSIVRNAPHFLQRIRSLSMNAWRNYAVEASKIFLRHLIRLCGGNPLPQPFNKFDAENRENDYCVYLSKQYQPSPFDGPVTLFIAEENLADPVAFWKHIAPNGLTVKVVKGDHARMLSEEHLSTFAPTFRESLLKAQSASEKQVS